MINLDRWFLSLSRRLRDKLSQLCPLEIYGAVCKMPFRKTECFPVLVCLPGKSSLWVRTNF